MKHIARLILKIFGWKLKGGLPADKKERKPTFNATG